MTEEYWSYSFQWLFGHTGEYLAPRETKKSLLKMNNKLELSRLSLWLKSLTQVQINTAIALNLKFFIYIMFSSLRLSWNSLFWKWNQLIKKSVPISFPKTGEVCGYLAYGRILLYTSSRLGYLLLEIISQSPLWDIITYCSTDMSHNTCSDF